MATATIRYLGDLRTEAVHTRSGSALITDAPIDNQGLGSAFSPTDLLVVSLVTCMMTTMAIRARTQGWPLSSMEGDVLKHMATAPRKVAKAEVRLRVYAAGLTEEMRASLRDAAEQCPVAQSLHPELVQAVTIEFI